MIACRPAILADGPALDAMARTIWLETFGQHAPPEDIALYVAAAFGPAGALIRDLADPASTFHLATDGERIIGYAKLDAPWLPGGDFEPGALQLSQIYVASDFHGRGIADALLDWTTETARERGAHALYLTVFELNHRAIRYYTRRGFAHVGDYAFHTGTQTDRDLIMRLAL